MTTEQVIEQLNLKVFTGRISSREVKGGYVSDLLSDVMGHAKEGEVWITLQAHMNVVAIASLKDLSAILLVKGIEPEKAVVDRAGKEGVLILGTREDTFTISGKLYQLLFEE
ncbi:MAG: DRTGG domain-containing protein [Bacteroidales bacterium]|nr:DRTGG domain-containing protein [Bacteroidales bacterium]